MGKHADLNSPGPWRALFASALQLMDHLEAMTEKPRWTFGGGTVLMLRLKHRHSRDIDLFVPDPQYLGYVTPRLSETAETLTTDYVEAAEYVKLLLPAGEIDVVVGDALTADPWEVVSYRGRELRIETNAEILAKKMYHRGNQAKARDLFDLCAVADLDPGAIDLAAPFFARYGRAFIQQLKASAAVVEEEFAHVQRISYERPFDECLVLAEAIIDAVVPQRPAPQRVSPGAPRASAARPAGR